MGGLFSLQQRQQVNISTNSAKVLPEYQKSDVTQIMIRHRPTCLSTDLEKGITETEENFVQPDTKSQ